MASMLGANTQFVGKIGKDSFGRYILDTLSRAKVETDYVIETESACTTLVFVHLDDFGERSFEFVRKPGADMLLGENDISESLCEKGDIIHFGSAQLMYDNGERAIEKAVRIARKQRAVISFDPDYRELQWPSEVLASEKIKKFLRYADIVKISEEEAKWLTGENDRYQALLRMKEFTSASLVMTCGADGGCYFFPCGCFLSSTFP